MRNYLYHLFTRIAWFCLAALLAALLGIAAYLAARGVDIGG